MIGGDMSGECDGECDSCACKDDCPDSPYFEEEFPFEEDEDGSYEDYGYGDE